MTVVQSNIQVATVESQLQLIATIAGVEAEQTMRHSLALVEQIKKLLAACMPIDLDL